VPIIFLVLWIGNRPSVRLPRTKSHRIWPVLARLVV